MDREKGEDTFDSRIESTSKRQKVEGQGDDREGSTPPSSAAPDSEGMILRFPSAPVDSVRKEHGDCWGLRDRLREHKPTQQTHPV